MEKSTKQVWVNELRVFQRRNSVRTIVRIFHLLILAVTIYYVCRLKVISLNHQSNLWVPVVTAEHLIEYIVFLEFGTYH